MRSPTGCASGVCTMTDDGSGRTLKTARAVLQVLKMMARAAPDGLRPDQVAEMLNKSTAAGTYLLNSLCREGFCCIAAPIFDRSGGLRGSLALSTTRARFDEDRERLIPIVMAVARAASHRGRSPSWEHLDPPHARHRTALQAVH